MPATDVSANIEISDRFLRVRSANSYRPGGADIFLHLVGHYHQYVPLIENAREKFPDFRAKSFDSGFHGPENRKRLDDLLDCAALPKKGRLN